MTPQELKTSILHLAFRGELVEQTPKECTAEKLYQQIKAEKRRLIKEGKLRKEKPLPVITGDEVPFNIPENWKWVHLKDICLCSFRGKYPVYAKEKNDYMVIGQAANQQNGLDFSKAKYSNKAFWESMDEKYFIKKNDVLLNTLGKGTLGRSCIVRNISKQVLTDGRLFVFRLLSSETSMFLYYYLQYIQRDIEKSAEGSTNQVFLSLPKINKRAIPLPPLNEQKRIVAKIEELFPYIEQFETVWNELEKMDLRFPIDLKKSILQMAVQGKLVEQRPEEGNAEKLYQQMQEEKHYLIKEGKIKKAKSLPEITEDEIPFNIPKTWKWVRIDDLLNAKPSYGISPNRKDYITPFKIITLTANTSGYFNPNAYKYVDIKKETAEKYYLKDNDILIQRANSRSLVGTTCIYKYGNDKYIFPDLIMRFHLLEGIDVKYIDYVLKSPYCRSYYQRKASGVSKSMPKINQSIVRHTLIPLAPLSEQKRIVKKIDEILRLEEKLK